MPATKPCAVQSQTSNIVHASAISAGSVPRARSRAKTRLRTRRPKVRSRRFRDRRAPVARRSARRSACPVRAMGTQVGAVRNCLCASGRYGSKFAGSADPLPADPSSGSSFQIWKPIQARRVRCAYVCTFVCGCACCDGAPRKCANAPRSVLRMVTTRRETTPTAPTVATRRTVSSRRRSRTIPSTARAVPIPRTDATEPATIAPSVPVTRASHEGTTGRRKVGNADPDQPNEKSSGRERGEIGRREERCLSMAHCSFRSYVRTEKLGDADRSGGTAPDDERPEHNE